MIQLFIFVSILVFFGLTLALVLNLRDSYRDEYLEIRKLRRRYASMAFRDAGQFSGSATGSCDGRISSRLFSHESPSSSHRKTALTEFFTVGDKCA
ncbi:MAG: hypothetical protein ACYCYM_06945 [Saccharofermentanales bacterium]